MTRHPYRLWIAALLLGWAFNFLFFKQRLGVNVALFTAACMLAAFLLLASFGLRPAWKSLGLAIAAAFFAGMTAIRQEPLTLALGYAGALGSLGLLVVTYLGGRWVHYGLFDYVAKTFSLIESLLLGADRFNRQVRKERGERGEAGRKLPVWPVVRGLCLAAPVVGLFSYLLASADAVYNQKVYEFFQNFALSKIGDNLLQLGIILLFGYVSAGALLHAALKSRDEKLVSGGAAVIKPFLGFTEAATVLGSVAGLFFIFVVIQFHYFFGGQTNIGVTGFTYSMYARRGFNELVAVAFLSLLLTLGLNTITRRENDQQRRIYSGLSVSIAALVVVILVSAYQRLSLAIDWHGFSRLRVYPRVFLIWVGILLVVVVLLEIFRQERRFALAALLASLGFAVSLSLLNVDASIARHNVYRVAQGKHFNASYLTSLSTDAVPTLVDAFMDKSLSEFVREGVGAALLCYAKNDSLGIYNKPDWRSVNFSVTAARRALDRVQPLLDPYQVNKEPGVIRVGGPSGRWYDCVPSE